MHWLAHFFGFDAGEGNGAHYLFWSGAGSDIAELAVVGGLVTIVRKHNCHQPRCWRVGRYPVPGTPWAVCRRHHPAPPGRETIRKHYHVYLGSKPGRG
jgi:hypothetical protein